MPDPPQSLKYGWLEKLAVTNGVQGVYTKSKDELNFFDI